MKILITGSEGQLGKSIYDLSKNYQNIQFIFTNSKTLNLTQKEKIYNFFKNNQIDIIVNCAAYTNVELAEINKNINYQINAESVKTLAKSAKKQNAILIHISSDYVFNGEKKTPYLPEDRAHPNNEYGKAKLLGEINALTYNPKTIIIRTSWLYSPYKKNFVTTLKKMLKYQNEIYIIGDQYGSPTLTYNLAEAILKIIKTPKKKYGIYHYSNSHSTSWFNFAYTIKEEIQKNNLYFIKTKKIYKINSNDYKTLAKRPIYSVLDLQKIQKDYFIKIYHWKKSLKKILPNI